MKSPETKESRIERTGEVEIALMASGRGARQPGITTLITTTYVVGIFKGKHGLFSEKRLWVETCQPRPQLMSTLY